MRKVAALLLFSLSSIFFCGCYVDLTTVTKINDDGSGLRITTYTAPGQSERDELKDRYLLPEGGSWAEDYRISKGDKYTYEVKREFKDINTLPPDYIRKGAVMDRVSMNNFSLKINKGLIFTTYEYEEVFRDSTNKKKVEDFCNNWYGHALEVSANNVAEAFPETVKKEDFQAYLDKIYRPFFDYFVSMFLNQGFKVFEDENNKVFRERMRECEEAYSESSFTESAANYILSQKKGGDRQIIIEKLKQAYKKSNEELDSYSEGISDRNYEDAFGVYGYPLFMKYSFYASVAMPGEIISSNAKEIKSNVAKWDFDNFDFFLKDYKMEVKSRKLNLTNVSVLAALTLVIMAFLISRGRKRK